MVTPIMETKLTKLGPAKNFAALNPPDWLADDLSRMAAKMPNIRLLVLFSDDLPDMEKLTYGNFLAKTLNIRREAFASLCKQHFRLRDPIKVFGDSHLGSRMSALATDPHIPTTQVFDQSTHRRTCILHPDHASPVRAAVIIMPPRHMTASEMTSATLHIPSQQTTELVRVNVHRATLGHQLGHLKLLGSGTSYSRHADERHADAYNQGFCWQAGDSDTAAYERNLRCLNNFLGEVSPNNRSSMKASPADHWNDLHGQGVVVTQPEEYAAMLELQLRSCGSVVQLPHNPAELVRKAFAPGIYAELHKQLADNSQNVPRIQALKEAHKKPYKYQYSNILADKVIQAAGQLLRLTP